MLKPLALIIENGRRLGDTLIDLLELLDLRCEYNYGGAQVRQQLTGLRPDLVLIDLPFHGHAGLDLLTTIRTDLRLRDTKVIVFTSDQYADTTELQLADAVLIKPFSLDLLEESVYRLIDDRPVSDSGEFASFSSIYP